MAGGTTIVALEWLVTLLSITTIVCSCHFGFADLIGTQKKDGLASHNDNKYWNFQQFCN